MQTIEIKNRLTSAILFTCEVEDDDAYPIRTALVAAVRSRANLTRANLAGADLTGADLAGADLTGANLADADLTGADLAGADLTGANLADANLADANLADADLTGANLTGANLADADLTGARNKPKSLASHVDPSEPYVRRPHADSTDAAAWLAGRRERQLKRAADYRLAHPNVPVVECIDARILEQIQKPGCILDMSQWHGGESYTDGSACGTSHCRAGWAVMIAGPAGLALERELGSALEAGRAIYLASTGRVPHFFASDERALEDLKEQARSEVESK